MEVFTVVIVCLITVLILFLCGYCCKRSKSGTVLRPPVTVTNTHITATPIIQPPYPVDTPGPMPQPLYPPQLGFSGYNDIYQTMPYQPASGQNIIPPPSYNEAISQPIVSSPLFPQTSQHFAKQPPYNPNY